MPSFDKKTSFFLTCAYPNADFFKEGSSSLVVLSHGTCDHQFFSEGENDLSKQEQIDIRKKVLAGKAIIAAIKAILHNADIIIVVIRQINYLFINTNYL